MNMYLFLNFPNALKYMTIHELREVQAEGGWENILRDRSGLVNRPLVAQTISANKDLANVKPSPVVFDMFYTSLEKKVSDLNTIKLLKLVKCLLIV